MSIFEWEESFRPDSVVVMVKVSVPTRFCPMYRMYVPLTVLGGRGASGAVGTAVFASKPSRRIIGDIAHVSIGFFTVGAVIPPRGRKAERDLLVGVWKVKIGNIKCRGR
jgi:hypothetical protein